MTGPPSSTPEAGITGADSTASPDSRALPGHVPKRVLVLGGSGFVGRALCRRLAARWPGTSVCVPTRRPAQLVDLRTLPSVRAVGASVHDDAALAPLVAGSDAVVNLVAILHGREADFEQAHVTLPGRLARALRGAGVHRLVHVSALGVAEQAPSRYLRSKWRGEQALQQAGLDLTLLRPSVIFGAEDRFLNQFADLQALAPVVPLGGADARFQPVWVEDVAEALVRALAGPVPPVIECAGPRVYSLADLVRLAGRCSGHPRRVLPLPERLARLQAFVLEHLPGATLMSRDNVDSMRVPSVATGTLPGLAALGIEASAIEAVMPPLLARR